MRQQLGLAPSYPQDAARLEDIQNAVVQLSGEDFGTFGYLSGSLSSSNTAVTVTGTSKAVSIRIFPTGADASFNVNGGNTITVRLNAGFDWSPRSPLVAPTINWVSGTFDYLIETA